MKKIFFLLVSVLLSLSFTANAAVYYVDASAADDSGAGTSWTTAKKTIAAAVTIAAAGDEIWIAGGTYNLTASIQTGNKAIVLYGGFAGDETSVAGRAKVADGKVWEFTTPTVINGFAGTKVRMFINNDSDAAIANLTLDGLTIQGMETSGERAPVLYASNGTNTIRNCIIKDNKTTATAAGADGGAIVLKGGTIEYCWFDNNDTSPFDGGAICISRNLDAGNTTIKHSKFTNNKVGTARYGGAIYIGRGTATIDSCEFIGNQSGRGGAISIATTNASNNTVTNSLFKDNISAGDGGGIDARDAANTQVANCIFEGNICSGSGGGLYFDKGTIHDCIIRNNKNIKKEDGNLAGGGGGLMLAMVGSINAYNLWIEGNESGYGGGVFFRSNGTATRSLYNSVIINNKAFSGTGIGFRYDYNNGANSAGDKVYNCIIANNSYAVTQGNVEADKNAKHSLGAGVFFPNGDDRTKYTSDASHGLLANCILYNNTGVDGSVVNVELADTRYSPIFNNNIVDNASIANIKQTDCIVETDPAKLFTNIAANDFTPPGVTFAGLNLGNTALAGAVDKDYAGNPRVSGNSVDIGAYEVFIWTLKSIGIGVNITSDEEQIIEDGAGADITFTLADGYETPIKVNGTEVSFTPAEGVYTHTLSSVISDTTITIEATAAVYYDVTVTTTGVTVTSPELTDGAFSSGASVRITFTVNTGYENPTVKVNDADYSLGAADDNGVYTITTTISAAAAVSIMASKKQFDVTLTVGNGIAGDPVVTGLTEGKAEYGESVSVTFTLQATYHSPYILANGIKITATENEGALSFSITNITEAQTVILAAFPANVLPVTEDTYQRESGQISGYYADEKTLQSRGKTAGWAIIPVLNFVPTEAIKAAGYNTATLQLVPTTDFSIGYTIHQIPGEYATINDIPTGDFNVLMNAELVGASKSDTHTANAPSEFDVTNPYVLDFPDEIRLSVVKASQGTTHHFHSLENGNPDYVPVLVFGKYTSANEPSAAIDPVIATKYYNLQGIEVRTPENGKIYIVKKTYASSKTDVSKIVFKR
jgi:hypothetical protein